MDEFLGWEDVKNRRFGTIAAASWNAYRSDPKKKKTWSTWKDWIPPFTKQNKSRGLTRDQIMQQVSDMRQQFYSWRGR